MSYRSLGAMHKLLFLILCGVPVITGAPQQTQNRYRKKKCHLRTETYLTNYESEYTVPATHFHGNDATATVGPYENGKIVLIAVHIKLLLTYLRQGI